jgi:ABC-type glycerol-3-phosphate transport system substrate-binding protein
MYAGPQAEAMSSTAIYWNEHYAKETRIFVRTFPLKNMDYFDKLKVELLSGISSPDIVNPFSFQLEELRPYLEPLNKYLIEDEFRILPDGQRFSTDSLIPLVLNNINSSDGQIYMLPNEIRGLVLYYRNDLILNPPQTWEEFIEIGKNYTQSLNPNSTTKYGIILPSEYDIWTFASALEMIWSYGDDLFLDPSAYYKNPGINLNATVRSFEIFEELTKFNITSFDLNNLENLDSASLLKTNDFAMALDWTDSYSDK